MADRAAAARVAQAVDTTAGPMSAEQKLSAERRAAYQELVTNPMFDVAVGFVILCNAATIGIEQSLEIAGGDTTPVQVVESFFLIVYLVELFFRVYAFGLGVCLADKWVRFDVFLVIIGLVSWISKTSGLAPQGLGPLMVLRCARLLRLAKTARVLMKFRDFGKLVSGLLDTVGVMFYALLLLFATLYGFGSLAIELITKHPYADRGSPEFDEGFREQVDLYFATLPRSMISLVNFFVFDNMSEIYGPLVEKDMGLVVYFLALILVVSIMLTNLITAVIVNSVLEQNVIDKEALARSELNKFKELVNELRSIFTQNDEDGSGRVTQTELKRISQEDTETLCRAMGGNDTPSDVFKALDVDQSGSLNINEFCEGMWQVVMSKAPPEAKRMEKQVEAIHGRLKRVDDAQEGALRDVVSEMREMKVALNKATRKPGPLSAAAATHRVSDDIPTWAQGMVRELQCMRSMVVPQGKTAIEPYLLQSPVESSPCAGETRAKSAAPSRNLSAPAAKSKERSVSAKVPASSKIETVLAPPANPPEAPHAATPADIPSDPKLPGGSLKEILRQAQGAASRNSSTTTAASSTSNGARGTAPKDVPEIRTAQL